MLQCPFAPQALTHPCCVLLQVTALVLYGVGVLQLLQKLDFFDDILPFLMKKQRKNLNTFLFLILYILSCTPHSLKSDHKLFYNMKMATQCCKSTAVNQLSGSLLHWDAPQDIFNSLRTAKIFFFLILTAIHFT